MTEQKTYDIDQFIERFSSELLVISDQHLSFINEYINQDGKRENKKDNNAKPINLISMQTLKQIHLYVFSLHILKKKGVTPENYKNKLKSFQSFKIKALEEFGIIIEEEVPYANPCHLYIHIESLLMKSGLNVEQKNNFYQLFEIRKRIPDQAQSSKLFDRQKISSLFDDLIKSDLSDNDWDAIENHESQHEYSSTLKELFKKHSIDIQKFDFTLFDNELLGAYIHKDRENKAIDDLPANKSPELTADQQLIEFEYSFIQGHGQNVKNLKLPKRINRHALKKIVKKYACDGFPIIHERLQHLEKNNLLMGRLERK